MIENELQYELTRKCADEFTQALASLSASAKNTNADAIHPLLRRAEQDALASQLESLQAELADYEARQGKPKAHLVGAG